MTQIDGATFRRSCPWCSAATPEGATHCPACGGAIAQRQSIGGLVIPGVTHVDPALEAIAEQPLHIPKSSPSQSVAGATVLAAAAGGPVGLAALGGLAAMAAVEYAGAGRGGHAKRQDPEAVGRPSGAVVQALERLEREEADRRASTSNAPATNGAGGDSAGSAPAPTSDPPRGHGDG